MFRTALLVACAGLALNACQRSGSNQGDQAASAGAASGGTGSVVAPAQAPYTGNPSPAASGTGAGPQPPAPPASPLTPAAFVAQAAGSDMYEIAEAKTALQKAQNPSVKAFAQKMIHDHTASTAALKAALSQSGQNLSMPGGPPPALQAKIQALQAVSGPDFDRAYIDQQVTAHQQALTLLQTYEATGDNAALKHFAAQTAPVVQGHLLIAERIQGQLKAGSPSQSS